MFDAIGDAGNPPYHAAAIFKGNDAAQQAAFAAAQNQGLSDATASQAAEEVWAAEQAHAYINNIQDPIVQARMTQILDIALLAQDVYYKQSIQPLIDAGGGNFTRVNSTLPTDLQAKLDTADGYYGGLYEDNSDQKYILVNRGTQGDSDRLGWTSDCLNNLGFASPIYRDALVAAPAVINYIGAANLGDNMGYASDPVVSFAGHSLGGGLAIAQAVETGRDAMVFNSSAIAYSTLVKDSAPGTNVTPQAYTNTLAHNVQAIDVDGDLLTFAQGMGKAAVADYIDVRMKQWQAGNLSMNFNWQSGVSVSAPIPTLGQLLSAFPGMLNQIGLHEQDLAPQITSQPAIVVEAEARNGPPPPTATDVVPAEELMISNNSQLPVLLGTSNFAPTAGGQLHLLTSIQ